MSEASNCDCACETPQLVLVPGSPGENGIPGAAGSNGVNAYTLTTSTITLPAAAGPVILATSVADSSWAAIGQVLFISDDTNWGHFRVLTQPSSTSFTLDWLQYPNDAVGTTVIASGAHVSPAGVLPVFAPPTDLTNSTGGTPGATLAAGTGFQTLAFYIEAASLANGDILTDYVPGYAFKILKFDARCAKIVSTGAKAATLNLEINAINLTGGVITLSGTYALGAPSAGTAVTAANVGTATDSFSVEASSVTAFVEGAFWLLVEIQNLDSTNSIASLNASITTINAQLT